MAIDTIRVRTESPDLPSERVIDVSGVSATRVAAYCREAGDWGDEVYLTQRGGRTYLVTAQ